MKISWEINVSDEDHEIYLAVQIDSGDVRDMAEIYTGVDDLDAFSHLVSRWISCRSGQSELKVGFGSFDKEYAAGAISFWANRLDASQCVLKIKILSREGKSSGLPEVVHGPILVSISKLDELANKISFAKSATLTKFDIDI